MRSCRLPAAAAAAAGALALSALLLAGGPAPTGVAASPEARRIEADVRALTADAFQGRRSGTPTGEAAARWVAGAFRAAGLLPAGDAGTYFQAFAFIGDVDLGPKNALTTAAGVPAGRSWTPGTDFRPLAFSAAGSAEGPLVFAGYGITAKELGWDDYAGLDVAGKVVLVLRHSPDGNDPASPFVLHTALRAKARNARERGAAAVLFATGPLTQGVRDELAAMRTDSSFQAAGIPAVSVRRPVAEALFARSGHSLEAAQRAIDAGRTPSPLALDGARAALTVDVTPKTARTANVVGLLPGNDPSVNTEAVVVGAHWDHIGTGASGSLDPEGAGKVHPGADDNASGVAALLELARTFAARKGSFRRSLFFVAFAAEEAGTLGSQHFLASPPVPLGRIAAMVNLDMVGHLGSGGLEAQGVGTAPGLRPLVESAARSAGLAPVLRDRAFAPSDHLPFAAAGRPVLFLFTGLHPRYHRPADRPETIDFAGIARVDAFLAPVLRSILEDGAGRAPYSPTSSIPIRAE